VTTSTASITLAIGTNPGAGTLAGTVTKAATSGVASFTGLSINNVGTGYTLIATASGLTGATSSTFNITNSATKLAITVAPTTATAGTSFSVTVQAQTSTGVLVNTATPTVTWTSTDAQAVLPGASILSAGTGTFSITLKTATAQTITVSSSGLTSATSGSITVSPGAASKLVFTTQPGGGSAGSALTPQPVVKVQDASGNTVTSSTASVSLSIGTNPGGGTLFGTASMAAVSGVATFSGLYLDKPGTGYTLTATSGALTAATSSAFTIAVGAPYQLSFSSQPGGGTEGATWAAQPAVLVQDIMGNTVTTSSASITLAIAKNMGGGTLSGTSTLSATSGQASFKGLSIDKAGIGYTLAATSTGLASATSSAFTIKVASQNGCEPGTQIFTFKSYRNEVVEEISDDSYFNQDFSIPANCTEITVKAWGAGGGGVYFTPDNYGGGGGFSQATLTVTPGETLNIRVGQGGLGTLEYTQYCSECSVWPWRIAGGGARGGSYGVGSGGGGSFVFRGKDVLIAAGGGGGGGFYSNMPGGAGGGSEGSQGLPINGLDGSKGGGGGTQYSGGTAGFGDGATAGQSLKGGKGGDPTYSEGDAYGAGGGGGGGYFGGGGGSGFVLMKPFLSGGGGGGSGFVSGSQTSLIGGSGREAANQKDSDYQSGIGMGGISYDSSQNGSGGDGLVVIQYSGSQTSLIGGSVGKGGNSSDKVVNPSDSSQYVGEAVVAE
jgi:hypothetical protein